MQATDFLNTIPPIEKAVNSGVTLPASMIAALDEIAKVRKTNRTAVVRGLLAPYVEQWNKLPPAKRAELAKEVG